MPSGGARANAGRPRGSGDPLKRLIRDECEAMRESRARLLGMVAGKRGDALWGLTEIAQDTSNPLLLRIAAYRAILPYQHSPMPSTAQVEHTHTTIDAEALREQFIARMNALAAARPVVIDAAPEPALPEPEPVEAAE